MVTIDMEINQHTTHEEMAGTTNPFIGVWRAEFKDGIETVLSHIHFLEKTFLYCIVRFNNDGIEVSRLIYNGTYNYNPISSIIFFEIEKSESETGISSSSYQFHDDKLYCYGNSIFVTEKLHSKVDISQIKQN
jgi:hypothetical protein